MPVLSHKTIEAEFNRALQDSTAKLILDCDSRYVLRTLMWEGRVLLFNWLYCGVKRVVFRQDLSRFCYIHHNPHQRYNLWKMMCKLSIDKHRLST